MAATRHLSAKQYDKELLRLQTELVFMQEWIVANDRRLVVLFEGRDTAGKGGVIKRITAYLNPRTLPRRRRADAERARALAVVLPALRLAPAGGRRDRAVRSQLVQPRRRRARDGLLHAGSEYEEFLRFCPQFEQTLQNDGILLVKYWLSVVRRGAGAALREAPRRSAQALEVQPDRRAGARALGRLRRGQGPHVRAHRHRAEPVVRGRGRRQAHGAAEPDQPPAVARAL